MTLHSGTSNPCTLDVSASSEMFTGHVLGTQCHSTQFADAGCGISDTRPTSFGHGFNDARGGVFALLWDKSTGISIWHFARADIPEDITNKRPTPANWGKPAGHWSSATCDIAANFYDHSMIIDTTVCGGWANGAYGYSGCPETCAEMVADSSNFHGELIELCFVARSADVLPRCKMEDQVPLRLSVSILSRVDHTLHG